MPFNVSMRVMMKAARQLARFANTVGNLDTTFWDIRFRDKKMGREYTLELKLVQEGKD